MVKTTCKIKGEPMKISILKESLCLGGTEKSAANISELLSQKYDVEVVLYDGSEIAYQYGGRLVDLNLPAQKTYLKRVINNLKRIVRYISYLNKAKPDIVYQFVSYSNPVGMIPLRKSTKIVSCRDFGALKRNIKKYKLRLNLSNAMVCNSQYMKDYYLKFYPEDEKKVFSINNVVDVDRVVEKSNEKVDAEFIEFRDKHKNLIVSVGRFCEEKAFDCLIKAFAKVREKNADVGLVLIGDGKLKEKYLKLINEYDLDAYVFFTGFQKNPYRYMSKCDIFVLSSYSEGFPNVIVEAMSLSLPVISVNCFSGPAEILTQNGDYFRANVGFENCEFGILTPHYDVKGKEFAISELSKAILFLISNEDNFRHYSALAAIRAEQYKAKSIFNQFDTLFNNLI